MTVGGRDEIGTRFKNSDSRNQKRGKDQVDAGGKINYACLLLLLVQFDVTG